MPSNGFQIGKYEYSSLGSKYYRSVIGESFAKEIDKRTYRKYYRQYYGVSKGTRTRSEVGKLSDKWKKQLWAKSSWGSNPWNNSGNRLHSHVKPLAISDKRGVYNRQSTGSGRTGTRWGAKLSSGQYKGSVFVLNNIQEWMTHLRIARHQLGVQAENFRLVVGQRALRVFQLSFKFHKFYNEGTSWRSLAPYTRRKRQVAGTWHGEQKSKLYETGSLASSLTNVVGEKQKLVSQVRTGNVNTKRVKISMWDVVRGVPVTGRDTKITEHIYAGIHNEGVPKGNKKGGRIPKRQFMGWSNLHSTSMDKVDTFAFEIADRYLFDSVFLTRKR